MPPAEAVVRDRHFPTSAGILFGLGLGGFFDGIVLHQVLQWHHVLSSWYPVNTIENLELNTRWDGVFHSATYCLWSLACSSYGAQPNVGICFGQANS